MTENNQIKYKNSLSKTNHIKGKLQPKSVGLTKKPKLYTKSNLKIGIKNSRFEHEADQVAGFVTGKRNTKPGKTMNINNTSNLESARLRCKPVISPTYWQQQH